MLAAPVLLLHYVRLVLWPRPLSADYSFDEIPYHESLSDPRVLLGAAVLAFLLYAAMRGGRFRVAALLFAIPLAGSLHLSFPLGTIFAERLLYLPMLGAALAFGLAVEELSKRRRWAFPAVAGVVLGASVAGVVTRVPDWRDNETLFRKTVDDRAREAPEATSSSAPSSSSRSASSKRRSGSRRVSRSIPRTSERG